mmetsp:Transcript_15807/g.24298  ORF Transcript_15807/g.24298 Transcript_15807/m.24298 type:complete len:224 (-) Transcript_15807:1692-2363(-)
MRQRRSMLGVGAHDAVHRASTHRPQFVQQLELQRANLASERHIMTQRRQQTFENGELELQRIVTAVVQQIGGLHQRARHLLRGNGRRKRDLRRHHQTRLGAAMHNDIIAIGAQRKQLAIKTRGKLAKRGSVTLCNATHKKAQLLAPKCVGESMTGELLQQQWTQALKKLVKLFQIVFEFRRHKQVIQIKLQQIAFLHQLLVVLAASQHAFKRAHLFREGVLHV